MCLEWTHQSVGRSVGRVYTCDNRKPFVQLFLIGATGLISERRGPCYPLTNTTPFDGVYRPGCDRYQAAGVFAVCLRSCLPSGIKPFQGLRSHSRKLGRRSECFLFAATLWERDPLVMTFKYLLLQYFRRP